MALKASRACPVSKPWVVKLSLTQTLSARNAAALDKDLMTAGGFSLDQLMELAGLAVSQAVYKVHPLNLGKRILVACGPGNNEPRQRLATQLRQLEVPFTADFGSALKESDHVVDAIFGFSFSGEIREPFPSVIEALESTRIPVTSVDAPSSWSIEDGPPASGPGRDFQPAALVSLTAPKPLVKFFKGRHFVGGRFLSPQMALKYDLEVPTFIGLDQVAEIDGDVAK
ncbi:MAG: hypothetical protein M1817_000848 [Caeruleum heppii]|nr:MAG: hypothetical protein M1817_000848 [Caeruleum heppii]